MGSETVMTVYQGVVLECQNCYTVCRFADTTARRHCPSCGLDIQNWDELEQQIREQASSPTGGAA